MVADPVDPDALASDRPDYLCPDLLDLSVHLYPLLRSQGAKTPAPQFGRLLVLLGEAVFALLMGEAVFHILVPERLMESLGDEFKALTVRSPNVRGRETVRRAFDVS